MGLDMYMTKRTSVKNWEHEKPEDKSEVIVKKGGKIDKSIKKKRISEIVEDVGYWRKANAIHAWIVKNVQEDEDDCKEYFFPEDKIKELLKLCKAIKKASILEKGKIKNPLTAKKLLPTQAGFFFGSEDYDEYYLECIEDTIKILTEALKDSKADYYYQSSW